MAKQAGILRISGTIGEVCFYKMDGEYYARKKSSLNAERVKSDPAFSGLMRYSRMMARASVIGSAVYQGIVKEKREKRLYNRLTGEAMRLLGAGWEKEEAVEYLCGKYGNSAR